MYGNIPRAVNFSEIQRRPCPAERGWGVGMGRWWRWMGAAGSEAVGVVGGAPRRRSCQKRRGGWSPRTDASDVRPLHADICG